MTLRSQLLNRLKEEGGYVCVAELERMDFRTRRGGLYKPSTVSRCLRNLTQAYIGLRIDKKIENGTVYYHYILSKYEEYDDEIKQQQLV